MKDSSDHEVKLCLLPNLNRDNDANTTITTATATTTTVTKHPSYPLPLPPPPPFQISPQPTEDEEPNLASTTFLFPITGDPEDPNPHHQYPTFMLNFLVALTFGLLIISVLSALGFLESSNPSPIFTVQSASVKSLTLTNTTSAPRHTVIAASGLVISLHIDNPYSYSKLKASIFQGCDLIGELVLPKNRGIRAANIGPKGTKKPSDLELDFGGKTMRFRVVDWISMDVKRNQAIGVSSFGLKIVAVENGGGAVAVEQVEMWCESVFLGFSTDPLAGKLLFGPARCRRIRGGTYGSDCV